MATYAELLLAAANQTLFNQVRVACIVAAETVRTEDQTTPNHANRFAWAKAVFSDPDQEAKRMLWAVLAQNRSATLAAIIGASDAVVQTAVNNEIDVFAS